MAKKTQLNNLSPKKEKKRWLYLRSRAALLIPLLESKTNKKYYNIYYTIIGHKLLAF